MKLTQQYISAYRIAEKALLKAGVCAFPIDPVQLARRNGVLVAGYEKFSAVSRTPMEELLAISADGFCVFRQGSPIIVYNHQIDSVGRKRWTVLHELSHILLGHIDERHATVHERQKDVRRWMEQEADLLTRCLIAPAPVALVCGVADEKELRALFGLSGEAAEHLYRDYRALCTGRQILALGSEQLLSRCTRFFAEWQLKRFYLAEERNRRGRYGKQCDVSVCPDAEELGDA